MPVRRDWGRVFVRVLCFLFALIGAVPLALGVLVRTEPVRAWAARETAALLQRELGLTARYEVRVHAWPFMIGVNHLVLDASDGGPPFLELERMAIRPRLFSLLAGHLDAGEVEIVGPRLRAVVKDGALQNLALPSTGSSAGGGLDRAPLSSVAITDARIDLTIDAVRVQARAVDLDLSAESSDAIELALRAGRIAVVHTHPLPGREAEEDSVDEDVVCRFDTRVRLEPGRALVRRLILEGAADFDPDPGTTPPCELEGSDWRRVELELGALRVIGLDGAPSKVSGRVRARLPVPIVHRFVDLPAATGSVSLDVEADYDAPSLALGEPLRLELPRLRGTITADQPGLDGKLFVTRLAGAITTTPDAVRLEDADIAWADGTLKISRAELRPFEKGMPLHAGPIDVAGVELPGLLRDLGVHPSAHVAWTLREGRFERFGGTLSPLSLEGPLVIHTRDFEIFDRPTRDPARRPMMGVKEGSARGTFVVRPDAVVLSGFSVETPRSRVEATVTLGFNDTLGVDVYPGSRIDLEDVSPVGPIELTGVARLKAALRGPYAHPKLTGEIAVERFVFGGFPIGDVEPSPVAFEPLVLTLENARVKHGASRVRVPSLKVDFDPSHRLAASGRAGGQPAPAAAAPAPGATPVVVDATVDTREAPHLAVRDLLEVLRLDKDPRFAGYAGVASGTARVHFAVGGPEDRCGGGYLDVHAGMRLRDVELLGERYDEGEAEVDLIWDDQAAGGDGMRLDLRSASLRKGPGSVLANVSVRHGGAVKGSVIASGIPLRRLDALGPAGALLDGSVSMVANLGGTMSRLSGLADIHVSRVRVGATAGLPPSRVELAIEPLDKPPRILGRTRCGNPQGAPFDPVEHERDLTQGDFVANGSLFDGRVQLDGLRISRQERKIVRGKVRIDARDLGTLAGLIPGVSPSAPPKLALTAALDIDRLPLADPRQAALTLTVNALDVEHERQRLRLTQPSGPIRVEGNVVKLPALHLEAGSASGLTVGFTAGGEVKKAFSAPDLAVAVRVEPTKLSRLSADIPQIRRASGEARAEVTLSGPISALRYAGWAELKNGELDVEGFPASLDDIDVEIAIGGDEVRLKRATARVGTGTVSAVGGMLVRGLSLGTARAAITARGVRLPVADGVDLTANADLVATFRPGLEDDDEEGERNLPRVDGTVTLTSFNYTRPIVMSVDLGALTGRQRTTVETYDPAGDVVRFEVKVVSLESKPLRFSNNLADMKVEVSPTGLTLSGTNQRFGARGTLKILPDSKLMLRTTEFNVREGYVHFSDPFRIAPKVDVHAESEYRRYDSTSGSAVADASAAPDTTALTSAGASASSSGGGRWRIKLHAQGDAENLRLNLTSDPPLSQEDIVLLLTLGMTRAELNRGLTTSLGETMGLEALSSLTGADRAVKTIVPLIDEFRFGTGYSSKTGTTEPTVTLGKRITDAVRANVTTGISQTSEVRGGVEVKLSDRMSVQGSYDNASDLTSSPFGNLGVDLRWRLEFE